MSLFGPPDVEKLKTKGNVQGLIKALGYKKDAAICQAAAQALVEIGHARDAVEALGKMGDERTVEPLIALLKDKDSDVRQDAARALGQIGDARAVKPLIAALKDQDMDVRQGAAEALEKIGTPAVEPLIAALKDTDKDVRKAAAGALDNLGWQPDRSEAGALCWAEKRQWDKCVEIGAPAVEPLIAALKDRYVRRDAAVALGQIGDARAVEPLIATLKDESQFVRRDVARALGQIGDARAVEPLIAALKDADKDVREATAGALDNLGWRPDKSETGALYWIEKRQWDRCAEIGVPAVELLIAALKDRYVCEGAAGALEKIGTPSVEPLIAALKDESWSVREATAEVLGKIGDPRAVEPLITALKDVFVRRAAAEALEKIGVPAVEPLIAALKDADKDVRQTAAKALDNLGWQPDSSKTGALYWVAKRHWDRCVEIGAPAVEPLITVLNDMDKDVRQSAPPGRWKRLVCLLWRYSLPP